MKRLLPARLQAALAGEDPNRPELPPDLLREPRRRVRIAAWLGTLAYGLFMALEWSDSSGRGSLEHSIDMRHDVVGLSLCFALGTVATLPRFQDRWVLRLALVAEFVLCAVISSHAPWAAYVRTGHVASLTWVVPVVILFALLVPFPGRVTFAAAAACLATVPAGQWALAAAGKIRVSTSELVLSTLTAAVALAIATLAARTLYGASRQLAAARQVGSYQLIERLGRGGMGEVWKAQHLLLARPAAVKRILAESLRGSQEEHESALERFTREARVTADLRSPHTVELFDFGADADGSLYYAMELLDGLNLEHFVYRFGAVEPRRAVHWLRQVCHSLAEAHARGLVHRDIKPANLFLCRYGLDADFVKVLDFGLTRPGGRAPGAALTEVGQRVGTPGYMAPEQVFGLDCSPRTDLYALGCVGYWLLAGARPFEGSDAGELLRQHAQADPPPLSKRAKQPVPPELEAVILGCLSKDPEARPADANELSARLAGSMEGAPWTERLAREWWDQHLPPR